MRIPFFGGQTPFSSKDVEIEETSDAPFHEEVAKYFNIPDEYYESWGNIAEEAVQHEETMPSVVSEITSLGIGIVDHVDSVIEEVADSIEEFWYHESNVETEYDPLLVETTDDTEETFPEETEDELIPPPEGSIFGAAFDPPKFPGGIPKPNLPSPPHLPKRPKRPNLPKRPVPPRRPHPPSRPHWPGHRPHKGPNPHFKHVNGTIFEFLANSTHHKILYKLVKNDTSLIDLFNTTGKDGKITLFAPTDCAFEKILKHLPKNHTHPPKWLIRKVIEYHTIGSFYPAGRVLAHRTIPTLFKAHHGPNLTQRIRIGKSLKGVNINFYAHPVFFNIFTKNGVVHAIDNILLPPPPTYFILEVFPTFFSTFFQALHETKVAAEFFPWRHGNSSWTIFLPTNIAFVKIPLGITAFLFSPRGHRILTKLVEYHISPNTTWYTDSLWKFLHPPHHPADKSEMEGFSEDWTTDPEEETFPHKRHWRKEFYNTTLPTLIDNKNATLHIREFKFGPFVKIGINGRPAGIFVNDILAYDGVIQATDRIILPPRRKCHHGHHAHHGHHEHHGKDDEKDVLPEEDEWIEGFAEDEEWTIENLKRIFNEE